jgi:GNAT superfamily N-acetyltransferase
MRIRPYDGDREALRHLFREADDSDREIDRYMRAGEILVADEGGEILGQLLLIPTTEPDDAPEVKSLAVVESRRGAGIGRTLIEHAAQRSRDRGARR